MTVASTQQIADGVQAIAIDGSGRKPRLVMCAASADGHTMPVLRVASELALRGYPITFIGGEDYRSNVEAIGAELFVIPNMFTPEMEERRNVYPPGIPRLIFDMKEAFIGWIPKRWEVLKETLETLRARDASEELIILSEPFFMGTHPLVYGAPLPKGFTQRPKVIKMGISPYVAYSIDVGPGGPGLPPDSSESGRARNALLQMMFEMGPFAEPAALEGKIMQELGAVDHTPGDFITKWFHAPDLMLQMTPPSVEYPRSDIPEHVKFIGCLTPKPIKADFVYPSWWDEVTKSGKKVVMVTQGTVQKLYTDLIIPTLQGLAERDDLYVVAILGTKGAKLPDDVVVPANARVIDYLSYDALLPHTDVFVCNGGYGGFLHGINNAVPMVMAGATEDKPEVCMRGEWSGIAVNLRTGTPSAEQVRDGVDKILENPKFKAKVTMVQKENLEMKALDQIEKYIQLSRS
jgi:UDP:flavonoid glycosyltransferase YjiC (YdhE family)